MVRIPKFEPIDYLVSRKFKVLPQISIVGLEKRTRASELRKINEQRAEIERKADAYREHLKGLSESEFQALYDMEKEAEAEENREAARVREARHPFNQIAAVADTDICEHWSKNAYWSLEEGAALLLRRDPAHVNWSKANEDKDKEKSQTGRRFLRIYELASRAANAHQIQWEIAPSDFLAWAKLCDLDIPTELERFVRDHENRKRSNGENNGTPGTPAAQSTEKEKLIGTRERESLLKMVIGMAIKGYGYDPDAAKSALARELSEDLALLGLSLSDDTIRSYLKEARELLPRDETE